MTTALRNLFVFGLKNKSAQTRCLEQTKLTLDEAVAIAKGAEVSESSGIILDGRIKKEMEEVNKINEGTRYQVKYKKRREMNNKNQFHQGLLKMKT